MCAANATAPPSANAGESAPSVSDNAFPEPTATAPPIVSASNVDSIAVGPWEWSCAVDCANTTCVLGPDPCAYANDGACDVPEYCDAGDHADCGGVAPVVAGTLPDAIGRLSCRSKIEKVYVYSPGCAPLGTLCLSRVPLLFLARVRAPGLCVSSLSHDCR